MLNQSSSKVPPQGFILRLCSGTTSFLQETPKGHTESGAASGMPAEECAEREGVETAAYVAEMCGKEREFVKSKLRCKERNTLSLSLLWGASEFPEAPFSSSAS